MTLKQQRGEMQLVVEGKRYTLVLNTDVMATLEDHLSTPNKDVTWDHLWGLVMRGSVKTVRALLWAMLQPHHPTMTIHDVSALIDRAGGFEGLRQIFAQTSKASTPDPKDVKELDLKRPPVAQATRRGTGGASTSTRDASA